MLCTAERPVDMGVAGIDETSGFGLEGRISLRRQPDRLGRSEPAPATAP